MFLGYEGIYEISNKGAVWCKKFGKCKRIGLKKDNNSNKYIYANLLKNGVYKQYPVHRLVAMTFLNKSDFKYHPEENPNKVDLDKLIVHHKDENKQNNCVENLEWCTNKYNLRYSSKKHKGKPIIQYDLNYTYIRRWSCIGSACNELKLSKKYIYDCCEHKRRTYAGFIWNYEDDEIIR